VRCTAASFEAVLEACPYERQPSHDGWVCVNLLGGRIPFPPSLCGLFNRCDGAHRGKCQTYRQLVALLVRHSVGNLHITALLGDSTITHIPSLLRAFGFRQPWVVIHGTRPHRTHATGERQKYKDHHHETEAANLCECCRSISGQQLDVLNSPVKVTYRASYSSAAFLTWMERPLWMNFRGTKVAGFQEGEK
jgi:hypothetical protein